MLEFGFIFLNVYYAFEDCSSCVVALWLVFLQQHLFPCKSGCGLRFLSVTVPAFDNLVQLNASLPSK